ncbi:MAG: inorganic phosphate transporter [Acidimicrobiales bacterium]
MTLAVILLLVALGYALLNGANNGSTIVAIATSSTTLLPATAIAFLAAGLAFGPLVLGTLVARTIANRLVNATGFTGELTFLVGIVAAVLVIGLLAWRKLPSSLTLATIGGLAGSALAGGLRVSWTISLLAVALAITVPLVTGLVAFVASKFLPVVLTIAGRHGLDRRKLRWFRNASFALQALAYATNDGQRMIAVMLVALGTGSQRNPLNFEVLAAIAAAFALGAVIGTGRMARGAPAQIAPGSTFERSLASVIASLAAFSSSALGIPVSMTQTTSAALVGAHTTSGKHRVRWEETTKLLSAWVLTLPASAALGALGTLVTMWVR